MSEDDDDGSPKLSEAIGTSVGLFLVAGFLTVGLFGGGAAAPQTCHGDCDAVKHWSEYEANQGALEETTTSVTIEFDEWFTGTVMVEYEEYNQTLVGTQKNLENRRMVKFEFPGGHVTDTDHELNITVTRDNVT